MTKKGKKWVGVLYAAVLMILAAAGVFYCVMLKYDADAANEQNHQYAAEEQSDLLLDADAEENITLDEIEVPAGAAE